MQLEKAAPIYTQDKPKSLKVIWLIKDLYCSKINLKESQIGDKVCMTK